MTLCSECGRTISHERLLPRYEPPRLGLAGVVLLNAVLEERCDCCESVESVTIPNLQGMIAAASVCRILDPTKLRGSEIRFLRKALEKTGSELGEILNIRKETVSRWENDQEPIGPHLEKLLRLLVGDQLGPRSAVRYESKQVLFMKIRPWRSLSEPVHIELVLECETQTPSFPEIPEPDHWRPVDTLAAVN